MNRTVIALAGAPAVAMTAVVPTTADAECRGCGIGAGIIGGLAAGAIIGGAIANSGPGYYSEGPRYYRGYAPVEGYEPYAYNAGYPVGCPGGYWARRPLVDRWGNVV